MVDLEKIKNLLSSVSDPEIPVLTIADLGILRDVKFTNGIPEILITPTYSGCPAMDAIAMNIRMVLLSNGYKDFKITQVLSPAWTTDWMTEAGKQKLRSYGIAAPAGRSIDVEVLEDLDVECPQCRSHNTRLISAFGSTSCKALFQCNDCKEPFDYFKCH